MSLALTIAAKFVAAHEGCRLTAYQDSKGVWTIGYGHTAHVSPGMECTQAEADSWLNADLNEAYREVLAATSIPLSDQQAAALISLEYNTGGVRGSILVQYVNTRQFIAAAHEFPAWDHSGKTEIKGLLIRRFEEASLFLKGS